MAGMASISCAHCGAPVNPPADLTALDATCEFCKQRTPLPPEIVKLRLREQEQLASQQRAAQAQQRAAQVQEEVKANVRRAGSMALWITLISVALPIIITGVVLMRVFSSIGAPTVPRIPHSKTH